ncbi:hypothetical protein BDZ94DRAFT_1237344 [Collybia nuda]|uniref:Uncharacterized protein n=1 Tax=Collybia nuda TaxID=64659 RepID=A0A9P6CDK6_9AGAR|nr:hypothetical protein BDZ94DRAFT_1237344 [Collybia nuda]
MASNNAEINDLRAQVEGYRTKMSLLQQEVSLILDKSDKIELLRKRELEEACRARDHLEIKLQKYKMYVKQLERERDDLRESVTEFIDKVESNPGALNLWPRSHMEMQSFPDPVSGIDRNRVLVDMPELQVSYFVEEISRLKRQRDLEYQNSKQMQDLFETQIRILWAQVARRDAIIAACQEHASHHIDLAPNPSTIPRDRLTVPPLSDEQIIEALRKTMENNRALEAEVWTLGQKQIEPYKLERAKLASAQPVSASPALPRMAPAPPEVSVAPDSQNTEPILALQHEPALTEPGKLEPTIPGLHTATYPSNISDIPPASYRNADISHRPYLPQIDALDHQINYLSSKIDAFKEERNLLKEVLVLQQSGLSQDTTSGGVPRPVSAPKYIPEPSRHTISGTSQDLQTPWDIAPAQEQNSQEVNAETPPSLDPNAQILDIPLPGNDSNEARSYIPGSHEDYDGEISMELATPLTPSNIVLPGGVMMRTSRTQSPTGSDTNEESPRMIRPRILSSPLPASMPSSPTQRFQSPAATSLVAVEAELDLERLRRELSETQNRLRERDQEVAELRAMLQTVSGNEEGT